MKQIITMIGVTIFYGNALAQTADEISYSQQNPVLSTQNQPNAITFQNVPTSQYQNNGEVINQVSPSNILIGAGAGTNHIINGEMNNISIGHGSSSSLYGVAIGTNAQAISTITPNSTAIDIYNKQGSTAIGVASYAVDGATAIGKAAGALGNGSVALGDGTVNYEANTVAVGSRRITQVANGLQGNDAANVSQVQRAKNEAIAASNAFTTSTAVETLSTSKNYTDVKTNQAISTAASYTNSVATNTLNSANSFTNQVGETVLNSANTYTDSSLQGYAKKDYVDTAVAGGVTQANTYTDVKTNQAVTTAASYTNSVATNTLNSANSFTNKVGETVLNSANTYTDQKFNQVSKIAYSAASVGMASSALVFNPNLQRQIAVGAATVNGTTALALGVAWKRGESGMLNIRGALGQNKTSGLAVGFSMGF